MVLPAKIRAQLGETGMVGMADGCLGLWTIEGFDAIADRLAAAVAAGEAERDGAAEVHGVRLRGHPRPAGSRRHPPGAPRPTPGSASEVVVNGAPRPGRDLGQGALGGARRPRAPPAHEDAADVGDTFAALRF